MNVEETPQYLLIFRGTDWDKGLPADVVEQTMTKWMAWFEGLKAEGKVKGGNPLFREGKVVSGKNGRVVSDGPFAESKEAVAGYFLAEVATLDEAVAMAKNCPALEHGMEVEVRQISECCGIARRINEAKSKGSALASV